MANPQKEDGYTAIANEIIEALAGIRIPGEARQVLDCIIRKTYGFNKREDMISLSQFVLMTNLPKVSVIRARNTLLALNLIIVNKKANDDIPKYRINKNFDTWKPLTKKRRGVANSLTSVNKKANASLTKKRTTKDTTTKDTITKDIHSSKFDEIWEKYPNKVGKTKSQQKFERSVKTEKDWEDIQHALDIYLKHLKLNSWKKPQDGKTWFNSWRDWVDYKEPGIKSPEEEKRNRIDALKRQIGDLKDNMEQEEVKEILTSRGYSEQEIDLALGRR